MGFVLSLLYTVQKIYPTSSTLPFKNLIKHLPFHILLKILDFAAKSPDYTMIIRRNRMHLRLVYLINNLSVNI